MTEQYIMAIDQGTTGTTVCLVDEHGKIKFSATENFPQIFPQPGWVEHRPEEIWQSVLSAVEKVLKLSQINPAFVKAIGITNQRETTLMWDSQTGVPVANAIVWQCRRTQKICEKLRKKNGIEKEIKKRTGLVIDPYFSGTKFQWLLENIQNLKVKAKKGEVKGGTIDTFLLWKLTDGRAHKTDVSNASRTLLMNIHTGEWDPYLLKLFAVPGEILPEIKESSGIFGTTKGLSILPDGIPISGIAGDQQAALFGQACFAEGEAKCTFGTGSFLLLNTGNKAIASRNRLLTTVAWKLPGKKVVYALEGGAFICGAAVQWLRDGLGILSKTSDVEVLASQVESTEGVEFVPALTGMGAPHWWPEARGLICGLTRGSTKAHIARATLDAMALQNTDILLAMQSDLGKRITTLKVDGGASVNNLLMQIQADTLGRKVVRPESVESTSLGAAYLAGLGIQFWKSLEELREKGTVERVFLPQQNLIQRKKRLLDWKNALRRTGL